MANLAQLEQALINADKAGNTEDAKILAAELRRAMPSKNTFAGQADLLAEIRRSSSEESGFIENIMSGFGAGVVNTGEMAALGGAALLEEDSELSARDKIQSAADYLRPEGGDQDALTYQISSGLGSVVSTLGAAAAATYGAAALGVGAVGAGIAGLTTAGAVGVGAGAGEASERARAAGATKKERDQATLRGAAIGTLEIIPLGKILKIPGATRLMEKIGGKTVEEGGSKIRSALSTGGVEAAQEAAAAFLQNMNERGYNPEKELLDAGIIDEAVAGGGAGVILQGVVDFFVKGRAGKQSATDPTSEIPPEEDSTVDPVVAETLARETEASALETQALEAADRDDEAAFEQATAEAAQPDLFTRELQEAREARPEVALREQLESQGAERVPQRESITDPVVAPTQVAPVQEDMLDRLDKMELEDAEIAELEGMFRADKIAEDELAAIYGESEQETNTAAQKDAASADRTIDREAALEAVIGEPTTGSYVNLERKFTKELEQRNIASGERAKPTEREVDRIRRAADVFAGMRPQEEVKPAPTIIETTPEATQLDDIEARIPERKAAAKPAAPSQLSFPNMGRSKTPRIEETPTAPNIVTKEFMDGLGIAPLAAIRKRTEGKDLNDPAIRNEFVKFVNDVKMPEKTRLNIARNLEGTPEAQLDLFQPKSRKRAAPDKGETNAATTTSQSTTSGASVSTPRSPVGAAPTAVTTQPDTEVSTPPSGRGVADAERSTSDPVRGKGQQQRALNLPPEPLQVSSSTAETLEKKKTNRKGTPKKELVSDAKPAQVKKATTPKQVTTKESVKKKTSAAKKVKPVSEVKDTTPKQTTKKEPVKKAATPKEDKQLDDLFDQQPEPVRQFSDQTSQEFNKSVGKEQTTADDKLTIFTLLTNGATARDKLGKAVITYLGKLRRPSDGLFMAIYDVANSTSQFRTTPDMSQAEVDFFKGMGSKSGQDVLDWAKANLSAETNAWIDKTLANEIRQIERIQNTDYIDMFNQRDSKIAVKDILEDAQVAEDAQTDARANLEELGESARSADRNVETEDKLIAEMAVKLAARIEKKLERGSVMGLDMPLHPAVRGLLRAGNLKGALRALSVTTADKRIANMANKLADVVDSLVVTSQGLGMGVDARKKRAKGQGFDTGTTYYHGTNADFTKFSKEQLGETTGAEDARMGFFFASNPAVASTYADTRSGYEGGFVGALNKFTRGKYEKVNEAIIGLAGKSIVAKGGRVMPVYLRMENPLVVDHKDKSYDEGEYLAILEQAYENGNDGVVIKNTKDEGFVEGGDQTTDISIVFDSGNIESTNAPFDPSERGSTKVEVVENLKTAEGEPVAGLFDPETNTIKLDSEIGMNPHVLLHEMTHAAASATLSNKSHPMTRQLTKLFEDVKPYLDTAYGAKDVDEFLSEAMSNPEFQAKLAQINPKGGEHSALQRFFNSVGNFLRKLVGMQPKKIESAQTVADRLVDGILAPAPKYRNANELPMASTAEGVKEKMKEIDDTQKALNLPLTDKFREEWSDRFLTAMKDSKDNAVKSGTELLEFTKLKLLDSQALSDVAKRADNALGVLADQFHKLMEYQRGSMSTADNYVRNQVKVVDKWVASGGNKAKQKNLNDLIYSQEYGATIYQVDPTKDKSYYKDKTDESGNSLEKVWLAQREDWKELGDDGQNAYKTMRGMYRDLYGKLKDAINGRIDEALKNNPDAAAELKKEVFAKLFDSNTLDVYFPLLREGRYKLEFQYKDSAVKSETDKYVFQMFDSFAQRNRVLEQLKKDPDVISNTVKGMDGDFKTSDFNNAPSSSFVKQVLDSLSANNVDPTVQSEIMRLFIDALPESSFAKSLQRRKGTPGYMQDAVYAMKTKGFDLGRQVEKLKYNALIQSMEVRLNEIEVPAEDFTFNTIRDEIKVRMNFAKYGAKNKGIERYVRTFNQIAFVGTIGFNVASAMVQTAQTPMFTYPMLGARYGYRKTYDEIMKATSFVTGARGYGGTKLEKISVAYGIDAYYDITDNGDFVVKKGKDIPAERIKELERIAPLVRMASERGHLNRSFIFDALGLQEGGKARKTDTVASKVAAALDYGTGISAMLFNQSERFNRQVTMVASYNLALDRIETDNPNMSTTEQRELAAEDALYDTQEYNGGSTLETAPRVVQENIGRVAGMYKTYGLRMYYTMFKTARDMVDVYVEARIAEGMPASVAKSLGSVAGKQIAGIHLSSLFFAGIHGVPLYGAVQLMADLILFSDDEDDTNEIVREYLGEGWYKGAFNQILDQAGIGSDVASRVRLTGLILQENRYNTNASVEEDFLYYLGGPALSVIKRTGRGIKDLYNGEMQRGVENLLPVGFSNAYKSLDRYQQDGGIYSRRGDPIYDDMTSGELFTQFLGFAPAEYLRIQEENQRLKRIDRSLSRQRSDLTKKYYIAIRQGDWSEITRIKSDIQKYNKEHPTFELSPESIARSLKQHIKTSETMYNGISLSPAMRRVAEEHLYGVRNGFRPPTK